MATFAVYRFKGSSIIKPASDRDDFYESGTISWVNGPTIPASSLLKLSELQTFEDLAEAQAWAGEDGRKVHDRSDNWVD